MQLTYIFSELGQGIRRNLSMNVAVVLTIFVSLTLVGVGLLMSAQAAKAEDYWGSRLQITVYLCNQDSDSPNCTGEITKTQKDEIATVIRENPEVADYYTETKAQAFVKVKDLYGSDEEREESQAGPLREQDMQETFWIELDNPQEFRGIQSAVAGLDGVDAVRDLRDILKPVYSAINALKYGAIGTAGFLVFAAVLLVANTIRLAAFARRREIGIMRLVGASRLYIQLPFLLESLVAALTGVALAAGALSAFMYFGIRGQIEPNVQFVPWVGWSELAWSVGWIAILGPVLTLVPTLVLTRKYLKV